MGVSNIATIEDFRLPRMVECLIKQGSMWQLCKEFLLFLKQEKRWWLVPLVVILLILGALIIFSSGSVLAPFMYPFM